MRCRGNLEMLGKALERYRVDNHDQYPASLQPLTPTYITLIPTCPEAGRDSYSSTLTVYNPSVRDSRGLPPCTYTVFCGGENHAGVGYSADYPRQTSERGLITRKRD